VIILGMLLLGFCTIACIKGEHGMGIESYRGSAARRGKYNDAKLPTEEGQGLENPYSISNTIKRKK
jgi:hypothetical protein